MPEDPIAKPGGGLVGALIEATPTIAYFTALSQGVAQSIAALAIAGLAALVIGIERRRKVRQDPIWLGCNLHFLIAGPLLWALFLSGQGALAGVLLDWVLFGVPLMVTLVIVLRAAQTPDRNGVILAVIALLALGFAATHHGTYVEVIAIPLGVIFWARLILRWTGGVAGIAPMVLAALGLGDLAEA